MSGHPGWCSPEHCYRTEQGVRVHVQAPVWWEDTESGMRLQTGLLGAEDEPSGIPSLELEWCSVLAGCRVGAILPLNQVRRIRDQLSAHLEVAESGRGNRLVGAGGRLVTSQQPGLTGSAGPGSVGAGHG